MYSVYLVLYRHTVLHTYLLGPRAIIVSKLAERPRDGETGWGYILVGGTLKSWKKANILDEAPTKAHWYGPGEKRNL